MSTVIKEAAKTAIIMQLLLSSFIIFSRYIHIINKLVSGKQCVYILIKKCRLLIIKFNVYRDNNGNY